MARELAGDPWRLPSTAARETTGDEFRRLAESIPDIVIRFDRNLRHLYANLSAEMATGQPAGELLGKSHREVGFPEEAAAFWEEHLHRVFDTGEPDFLHVLFPAADGVRHHVVRLVPDVGPDGAVETVLSISRDVTGRVRAEEGRRAGEDRERALQAILADHQRREDGLAERCAFLEAVLNQMPCAFTIAEASSGKVTLVNEAARRLFGDAVPPASPAEEHSHARAVHRNGRPYRPEDWPLARALSHEETLEGEEIGIHRADGSRACLRANTAPVRDAGGRVVAAVSVYEDTTERRLAEGALRRSEEELAKAQEIANLGSWTLDLANRRVACSRQMNRMLGLQPEDSATPLRAVVRRLLPSDRRQVIATARQAIHAGERFQVEHRIRRVDGTERVVLSQGDGERNPEGRLVRLVGTMLDITERKQAQEEMARLYESEQAARAQAVATNAEKDQFVALVAHELRNPLSTIKNSVFLLKKGTPSEQRSARALETIERSVALQTRLVNDLLDLSRIAQGKLALNCKPTRLDDLLLSAIEGCDEDTCDAGLEMVVGTLPEVWVCGDADRMMQVVANLLGNAIKFTPPPGKITLSLAVHEGRGRVTVVDTGIGISPEVLPRIFEVFQQGDTSGKRAAGLGLGLALVRSLVEMHGGRVWAESEGVGQGSCFVFELPVCDAPAG